MIVSVTFVKMNMRNLTLVAIMLLVSISAFAQDTIPDAGFENWQDVDSDNYNPVAWGSSNLAWAFYGCYAPNVSPDSTDVHSGKYAARLESYSCLNNLNQPFSQAASLYSPNSPGFTISSRPLYVQGWYKYAPVGSDTAFDMGVTVGNNTTQNGAGDARLPATNTWTRFIMPIQYVNRNVPDFCSIQFSSSSNSTTAAPVGSVLLLDDLSYLYVPPGLTAPAVATDPATNVQLTSAQMNGTINPQNTTDTVVFEWGTTPTYGNVNNATPNTVNGVSSIGVSASLFGLQSNTMYYYRIDVYTFGTVFFGSQQTFFTSPTTSPNIATTTATNVSSTGAQLNATVNPNSQNVSSIAFNWGPTTSYGNTNAATPSSASGSGSTNASATIGGLQPNSTYYYQAVASVNGSPITGSRAQFTTTATGIPQVKVEDVSIYPNPAKHQFTINTHTGDIYTLELYNMIGQKVLSRVISQPVTTVDVSDTANGVYTVVVKKDEAVKSYRLVIVN
jgi:hypothetical protein